ncbi:hypothetical protein [Mycolicibacterium diernhoferi]|uniref:Uncharacterized protein n=1 Tax=Mycolicibacterium diernhoferi TaxID=1801 RepID=A0A1Q4H4X2_9MYCO|nr:hypothetical protein [Mycolicibacterium diernhoferi]OJZ62609.1 hypothetical protein BRW64_25805 [Mycolicibacterium diernhoferi]OPE54071.1 hypothetical protein BV510_12280 [Mycolicibacterium diernhoferi]PEG52422.1 hypothetical protein CRI78_21250 [Mycolicibacterium diernhoferi]QYL20774.1 hypothetical protein K0O62_17045 [Mycolicibacterium diernhoferi]
MTTENAPTGISLRRWAAGALVGIAAAAGLGLAPTATAEPTTNAAQDQPQPQRVSPDQVLVMISDQYQTGRGGGQISKLIEQVMTLRQRGVRPSAANSQALLDGLNRRPNQGPLIEALQATLSYQRRTLAQMSSQAPPQQGPMGPATSPGQQMGPGGWGPGNPMQGDSIFGMPGR